MAPLLTALVPFLLLPALLAVLGSHSALPFASFAVAILLLVPAAQVVIGLARLPILCLGGIAALGASAMPLLIFDLDWRPAIALAFAPLLGLVAGGLLWLLVRGLGQALVAACTLPLLLALAVLPAITADPDHNLPGFALEPMLLLPVGVALVLLLAVRQFLASPAARLHEAAASAALPADGLGLDGRAVTLTACLLAGALSAIGGALMALGPAPIITIDAGDWVALSLALAAIGRLGGIRLGAALLAALPLLLMPKLIVALAPSFVDLTLTATLMALVLQLLIRGDGSPSWQPPAPTAAATGLVTPRLAER